MIPRIIYVLAFGLWSGVMIGFAFIFAPLAFKALGPVPTFAALIANAIGAITLFGYGCAVAAIAASLLNRRNRIRSTVLATIAIVMAAFSWYETHNIVPAMERIQIASPAYEALHRESSSIYGVVLLLGLIALILSAGEPLSPNRLRGK